MDASDLGRSGLVAARRWVKELRERSYEAASHMLRAAPQYRDLTPLQYSAALVWLLANGVVDADYRLAPSAQSDEENLLELLLVAQSPPWLTDADELVLLGGDLPIDVLELGEALHLDEGQTLSVVRRAWRRFDDSAQRAVGLQGELALKTLLEADGFYVEQVSSYDDTAGYDLRANRDGAERHVEVKSTNRGSNLAIHVTRNEFETMASDPSWCLQIVHLDRDSGGIEALAWVEKHQLVAWSPEDALGKWESFRVRVPADARGQGMHPLLLG